MATPMSLIRKGTPASGALPGAGVSSVGQVSTTALMRAWTANAAWRAADSSSAGVTSPAATSSASPTASWRTYSFTLTVTPGDSKDTLEYSTIPNGIEWHGLVS